MRLTSISINNKSIYMIYCDPFFNRVVPTELPSSNTWVFTHFKQGDIHLLEKVEEVEVLRWVAPLRAQNQSFPHQTIILVLSLFLCHDPPCWKKTARGLNPRASVFVPSTLSAQSVERMMKVCSHGFREQAYCSCHGWEIFDILFFCEEFSFKCCLR